VESNGGWNPIGGRKHYTEKDSRGGRKSEKKSDGVHASIVVLLLVTIGAASYSLATHPGVPGLAKDLVTAIWGMLCDIGNAISDFIGFVKRQRSG
jgi:hypothetical protein